MPDAKAADPRLADNRSGRRFAGRRSAGRLKTGETADIVLLGRDPGESVDAFAAVRLTVARGRVVHALRADEPETCRPRA